MTLETTTAELARFIETNAKGAPLDAESLAQQIVDRFGAHPPATKTEPPRSLLVSMACRLRHDFGLLPRSTQESLIKEMAAVYEEVAGVGFWKSERSSFYEDLRVWRASVGSPQYRPHCVNHRRKIGARR